MEVIVLTGGKFHAFHLAEQLQKRSFLKKIITGYPNFFLKGEGVDQDKITSIPLPQLMYFAGRKVSLIYKHIPLSYWTSAWFDRLAQRKIEDCDIFVGWSSFSLKSIRKAKSRGATTIIDHGSSHILYQKEILKEEYRRYGLRASPVDQGIVERELKEYDEADYISIASEFQRQSFLSKGVEEEKLIKVPYGVDVKKFKPSPKNDDVFRVISVGATTLRKGVHYLLEAWSQLDLKQSELLLRGGVPENIRWLIEKYRRKCDFKIVSYIKEISNFYHKGSVFVLPSIEDGWGLVVGEAMASGLPVIISDNTGAKDIVDNGKEGFVIPVRDVQTLKEKIEYLYHNPEERKRMGKAARQRAMEFTWDKYGEKIVKAYQNLLS